MKTLAHWYPSNKIDFHTPNFLIGSQLSGHARQFYEKLKEQIDLIYELASAYDDILVEFTDTFVGSYVLGLGASMPTLKQIFSYLRVKLLSHQPEIYYRTMKIVDCLMKNCGTRAYILINRKFFMQTIGVTCRRFIGYTKYLKELAQKPANNKQMKNIRVKDFEKAAAFSLDCIQAWGEAFSPIRRVYPHIYHTYYKFKYKYQVTFLRPDYDPHRVPIILDLIQKHEECALIYAQRVEDGDHNHSNKELIMTKEEILAELSQHGLSMIDTNDREEEPRDANETDFESAVGKSGKKRVASWKGTKPTGIPVSASKRPRSLQKHTSSMSTMNLSDPAIDVATAVAIDKEIERSQLALLGTPGKYLQTLLLSPSTPVSTKYATIATNTTPGLIGIDGEGSPVVVIAEEGSNDSLPSITTATTMQNTKVNSMKLYPPVVLPISPIPLVAVSNNTAPNTMLLLSPMGMSTNSGKRVQFSPYNTTHMIEPTTNTITTNHQGLMMNTVETNTDGSLSFTREPYTAHTTSFEEHSLNTSPMSLPTGFITNISPTVSFQYTYPTVCSPNTSQLIATIPVDFAGYRAGTTTTGTTTGTTLSMSPTRTRVVAAEDDGIVMTHGSSSPNPIKGISPVPTQDLGSTEMILTSEESDKAGGISGNKMVHWLYRTFQQTNSLQRSKLNNTTVATPSMPQSTVEDMFHPVVGGGSVSPLLLNPTIVIAPSPLTLTSVAMTPTKKSLQEVVNHDENGAAFGTPKHYESAAGNIPVTPNTHQHCTHRMVTTTKKTMQTVTDDEEEEKTLDRFVTINTVPSSLPVMYGTGEESSHSGLPGIASTSFVEKETRSLQPVLQPSNGSSNMEDSHISVAIIGDINAQPHYVVLTYPRPAPVVEEQPLTNTAAAVEEISPIKMPLDTTIQLAGNYLQFNTPSFLQQPQLPAGHPVTETTSNHVSSSCLSPVIPAVPAAVNLFADVVDVTVPTQQQQTAAVTTTTLAHSTVKKPLERHHVSPKSTGMLPLGNVQSPIRTSSIPRPSTYNSNTYTYKPPMTAEEMYEEEKSEVEQSEVEIIVPDKDMTKPATDGIEDKMIKRRSGSVITSTIRALFGFKAVPTTATTTTTATHKAPETTGKTVQQQQQITHTTTTTVVHTGNTDTITTEVMDTLVTVTVEEKLCSDEMKETASVPVKEHVEHIEHVTTLKQPQEVHNRFPNNEHSLSFIASGNSNEIQMIPTYLLHDYLPSAHTTDHPSSMFPYPPTAITSISHPTMVAVEEKKEVMQPASSAVNTKQDVTAMIQMSEDSLDKTIFPPSSVAMQQPVVICTTQAAIPTAEVECGNDMMKRFEVMISPDASAFVSVLMTSPTPSTSHHTLPDVSQQQEEQEQEEEQKEEQQLLPQEQVETPIITMVETIEEPQEGVEDVVVPVQELDKVEDKLVEEVLDTPVAQQEVVQEVVQEEQDSEQSTSTNTDPVLLVSMGAGSLSSLTIDTFNSSSHSVKSSHAATIEAPVYYEIASSTPAEEVVEVTKATTEIIQALPVLAETVSTAAVVVEETAQPLLTVTEEMIVPLTLSCKSASIDSSAADTIVWPSSSSSSTGSTVSTTSAESHLLPSSIITEEIHTTSTTLTTPSTPSTPCLTNHGMNILSPVPEEAVNMSELPPAMSEQPAIMSEQAMSPTKPANKLVVMVGKLHFPTAEDDETVETVTPAALAPSAAAAPVVMMTHDRVTALRNKFQTVCGSGSSSSSDNNNHLLSTHSAVVGKKAPHPVSASKIPKPLTIHPVLPTTTTTTTTTTVTTNTMSNNVSGTMSNTLSNNMSNTMSSNVSKNVSNNMSNTMSNNVSNTLSNTMSKTLSNTLSNNMSSTMSNTVSSTMSSKVSNTVPSIVPSTTSTTTSTTTTAPTAVTAVTGPPHNPWGHIPHLSDDDEDTDDTGSVHTVTSVGTHLTHASTGTHTTTGTGTTTGTTSTTTRNPKILQRTTSSTYQQQHRVPTMCYTTATNHAKPLPPAAAAQGVGCTRRGCACGATTESTYQHVQQHGLPPKGGGGKHSFLLAGRTMSHGSMENGENNKENNKENHYKENTHKENILKKGGNSSSSVVVHRIGSNHSMGSSSSSTGSTTGSTTGKSVSVRSTKKVEALRNFYTQQAALQQATLEAKLLKEGGGKEGKKLCEIKFYGNQRVVVRK